RGARYESLRVGDERVDVVDRPLAALALHGGGVIEPGLVCALAADYAPQIRADLVRAALLKGMTGLAFFGSGLATLDVRGGQQGFDRLIRLGRRDLGAAAFALFWYRDLVARLFQFSGSENRIGSEV